MRQYQQLKIHLIIIYIYNIFNGVAKLNVFNIFV